MIPHPGSRIPHPESCIQNPVSVASQRNMSYYVSRYARVPFSNSYIPIPHTLPHRLRLTGDHLQVVVQAAPAGQDVLDSAMGGEEEMIDAYRIDEPGA